ncbi:MAG: hypothetical protein HUU57_01980 [Bdellovibrio sp.]|nr:hypothetical protein [Bdellovibrio sp.]
MVLAVILVFSQISFAQADRTVKRSVAAILFSSLGGAILGLSTLSFYGEPQEHTGNIAVGALVGFVGGISYVLYDSLQPPTPQGQDFGKAFDQDFQIRRASATFAKAPPVIQVKFEF